MPIIDLPQARFSIDSPDRVTVRTHLGGSAWTAESTASYGQRWRLPRRARKYVVCVGLAVGSISTATSADGGLSRAALRELIIAFFEIWGLTEVTWLETTPELRCASSSSTSTTPGSAFVLRMATRLISPAAR